MRSNIRVIERHERDERGHRIIPVHGEWERQSADPEQQGLFIAIGSLHDPYATIIPAVEVFRFFYATSDVLAKALLHDRFLDPHTHLWDAEKTAISADGRAVIWLRSRMLDADARFLARFAFDNYALHQAQQIFLYAAAAGGSQGERTIKALPPFEDTVFTQLLGCPIGGPYGNRILVTRLLRCDWKPPFTHLKWDRDNDSRSDPESRPKRDPADGSPNPLMVPDKDNPEPSKLADAPPSAANVPSRLKEAEIADRFPELAKTPAEKLPQENTKTRAKHRDWRPVMAEAYTGSVIDGRSSRELVGKTIIEGLERKPEVPKEQTDAIDASTGQAGYLRVLEFLLEIRRSSLAKVDFITVLNASTSVHGVEFNVYPEEIDGKKKAWLYVDEKKTKRRMALLAQATYAGRTRYVLELQQRQPKECSTLVVWQNEERTTATGLLACLVMDCARAGSATLGSARLLQMNWARLYHTTTKQSTKKQSATKQPGKESASRFLERIFDATPQDTNGPKSSARRNKPRMPDRLRG